MRFELIGWLSRALMNIGLLFASDSEYSRLLGKSQRILSTDNFLSVFPLSWRSYHHFHVDKILTTK